MTTQLNGWNLQQMTDAVEGVKQQPEAGRLTWRSTVHWDGAFAAQATARGLAIDELDLDLQGVIDLNGFFGLRPVRPGLSEVKLTFRVKSAADEKALREVLEAAKALSPVFDTVTRPVEVTAELRRS